MIIVNIVLGTQEVERCLRIFSSSSHPSQPAKFAVIKVGDAVLSELDELALCLSFLYCVGCPACSGPQMNSILEGEGVVPDDLFSSSFLIFLL